MKPVAAIVEPAQKPSQSDVEQAAAAISAILQEGRRQQPAERAALAQAKRELKKALRSRDAHRARIRSLLAMLPEDKREAIVAELGIDLASWSEQGVRPSAGAPMVPPVLAGHGVYFVQGVAGGPIKIGTSSDVADRVRALQCASPVLLHVIGVTAGDQRLEQALHRRLARHRLHGEWFADVPEVRSAIAEVMS